MSVRCSGPDHLTGVTRVLIFFGGWVGCTGAPAAPCDTVELVGDGVDQDCDGSDYSTVLGPPNAAGMVHWYGADFGRRLDCGPDRAGDGEGDIAITAPADTKLAFAVALPGPIQGTRFVDDVVDVRVTVPFGSAIGDIALLDAADGGGLLMGLGAPRLREPNVVGAVLVAESGVVGRDTPAFGQLGITSDGYSVGAVITGPTSVFEDDGPTYLLGVDAFEGLSTDFLSTEKDAVRLMGREGGPGSRFDSPKNYDADVHVGDLNGDGMNDLAVAYVQDPLVNIAFGPLSRTTTATPGDSNVGRYGVLSRDLTAHRVHDIAIGDFDGDGTGDLALGDIFYNGRMGAVHIWLGPLGPGDHDIEGADVRFDGETALAFFGDSLAVADFDDDGADELIVGAPDFTRQTPGLVYILGGGLHRGSTMGSSVLAVVRGGYAGDAFGLSLATCDLHRSGLPGLLVGAPDADVGDINDAGAVYWFDDESLARLAP